MFIDSLGHGSGGGGRRQQEEVNLPTPSDLYVWNVFESFLLPRPFLLLVQNLRRRFFGNFGFGLAIVEVEKTNTFDTQ